jgi:hypothetical protein
MASLEHAKSHEKKQNSALVQVPWHMHSNLGERKLRAKDKP